MEMTELIERARRQLAEITGLKPLGVTRVFKENGGWHINVEMLEMARIPDSSDVLGDYETVIAEDGHILRFERRRTRLRGEPMEQEVR